MNHLAKEADFVNWLLAANENIEEWGMQHPLVLLAAIQEELGEVSQAYLEATHEGGPEDRVFEEIDDLIPLLFQLRWSLDEHEESFTQLKGSSLRES